MSIDEASLGTGLANGQGSNSVNIRLFNERVILSALRRLGQASKADLSRHVSLTNNTAGVIVRELERRNLIRSEGKRAGRLGQPATLLSLNPEGAHAIGVKFGRRSIDVLLVDFTGRVVDRCRHERDFPLPEEALALALGDIAALRRRGQDEAARHLAGVGIAMPYNMDNWHRELDIAINTHEAWNGFDMARRIAVETALPVFQENDGTAAAVAELFQGRGRDIDNFLYVFIGSAIGGGIVLNGEYYRGRTGNAGDIGLMPVAGSKLSSAPAPSRSHDILLTRASINALIRHLRGNGVQVNSRRDLDQALPGNERLVSEWLDDCADALVVPLLSAASLLDVEAVVLDGDLQIGIIQDLIERLGRLLAEAVPEARTPPVLLPGTIGREAAALGAAILPLHLNFSPSRELLVNQ